MSVLIGPTKIIIKTEVSVLFPVCFLKREAGLHPIQREACLHLVVPSDLVVNSLGNPKNPFKKIKILKKYSVDPKSKLWLRHTCNKYCTMLEQVMARRK